MGASTSANCGAGAIAGCNAAELDEPVMCEPLTFDVCHDECGNVEDDVDSGIRLHQQSALAPRTSIVPYAVLASRLRRLATSGEANLLMTKEFDTAMRRVLDVLVDTAAPASSPRKGSTGACVFVIVAPPEELVKVLVTQNLQGCASIYHERFHQKLQECSGGVLSSTPSTEHVFFAVSHVGGNVLAAEGKFTDEFNCDSLIAFELAASFSKGIVFTRSARGVIAAYPVAEATQQTAWQLGGGDPFVPSSWSSPQLVKPCISEETETVSLYSGSEEGNERAPELIPYDRLAFRLGRLAVESECSSAYNAEAYAMTLHHVLSLLLSTALPDSDSGRIQADNARCPSSQLIVAVAPEKHLRRLIAPAGVKTVVLTRELTGNVTIHDDRFRQRLEERAGGSRARRQVTTSGVAVNHLSGAVLSEDAQFMIQSQEDSHHNTRGHKPIEPAELALALSSGVVFQRSEFGHIFVYSPPSVQRGLHGAFWQLKKPDEW